MTAAAATIATLWQVVRGGGTHQLVPLSIELGAAAGPVSVRFQTFLTLFKQVIALGFIMDACFEYIPCQMGQFDVLFQFHMFPYALFQFQLFRRLLFT